MRWGHWLKEGMVGVSCEGQKFNTVEKIWNDDWAVWEWVDKRNVVGLSMIESLLEISTHGFLIEHIFMFQNKMLFLFSHQ